MRKGSDDYRRKSDDRMRRTTGRAALVLALMWCSRAIAQESSPIQNSAQPTSTSIAPAQGGPSVQRTIRTSQPAAGSPLFSQGWFAGVQEHLEIEAGITANPGVRADGINFGSLYTDRANVPLFNEAAVTINRPVDKAVDYDVGFSFQTLYGTDGRTTHFLGQFDRFLADSRGQLVIVQASVSVHLPWFTPLGVDVKIGEYPTPLGFEARDPMLNPFYSHSYIYNGPGTSRHTGGFATTHISPQVDFWLGIDSGNGTTIGSGGDNNSAPSGIIGFGLNDLFDGKVTVLALSHIGPETPLIKTPAADRYLRFYNDAYLIYKYNERLSFTTEADYTKDDFAHAEGYGVSQYASYILTPAITLNARAEVFADPQGFWVASFPASTDYVSLLAGLPNTTLFAPPTTYGAITLGMTYKSKLSDKVGLLVRPELRYDRSLNGSTPFNNFRSKDMFTPAVDAILNF